MKPQSWKTEYSKPKWIGDLSDDCFLTWMGFNAHVEKMDDNIWFAVIYRSSKEKTTVFHSMSDTGNFHSGDEARRFVEGFIVAKNLRVSGGM